VWRVFRVVHPWSRGEPTTLVRTVPLFFEHRDVDNVWFISVALPCRTLQCKELCSRYIMYVCMYVFMFLYIHIHAHIHGLFTLSKFLRLSVERWKDYR
jgi:hypothetical protein